MVKKFEFTFEGSFLLLPPSPTSVCTPPPPPLIHAIAYWAAAVLADRAFSRQPKNEKFSRQFK